MLGVSPTTLLGASGAGLSGEAGMSPDQPALSAAVRAVCEAGRVSRPSTPFPEPTEPAVSRSEVFLRYLDYFRSRLVSKLEGLADSELRRSRLPSGWTPIELLKHLAFVEMRWLEWGFEGRDVGDPRADSRDGRWYVAPDEALAGLVATLGSRAARTRAIVAAHALDDVGQPGDRWNGAEPASLERVLFHLLQEYARHVGQLDIVCELAGGPTGE